MEENKNNKRRDVEVNTTLPESFHNNSNEPLGKVAEEEARGKSILWSCKSPLDLLVIKVHSFAVNPSCH